MQTRGARGGISGQVREARGRVRELAQTERAREQQQQRERRGKRATSEQQQPEREEKTEGGLSRQNHIVPRSLFAPNTKQQGEYRMERSCRSIS